MARVQANTITSVHSFSYFFGAYDALACPITFEIHQIWRDVNYFRANHCIKTDDRLDTRVKFWGRERRR
jgi:hypothetical protein